MARRAPLHVSLALSLAPLALALAVLSTPAAQADGSDGLPGSCVRAGAGPGDPIVYEVEGQATGIRHLPGDFGYELAQLDDGDGDGVRDFAASAPSFPLPDGRIGFVGLFSGRTGARLRHWLPPPGRSFWGDQLGVSGDIDRDGLRELVVMNGDGAFDVLSPRSGEILYQVPRPAGHVGSRGEPFVPLGDINGDGVDDLAFAVGAYDDAPSEPERPTFEVGRVAAHSGAGGRLLWERFGEEHSNFGRAAVSVGDLSGDGIVDLVVGLTYSVRQQNGPVQSPAAQLLLLSGADGSTLEVHTGEPWQIALGRNLAFLGDTDGNGRVEVVAAAPYAYNGYRVEAGWVGVFEVPGFDLRYEIQGDHGDDFYFSSDSLGFLTSEAGDADGDGAMDFLLSTDHGRTLSFGPVHGRLYLHSGRSGELLEVYEGLQTPTSANPSWPYFSSLAPLGDADGDGREEFLVGAGGWAEDSPLRGYVQLLRFEPERAPLRRGELDGDGRYTITDIFRLARGVFAVDPVEPCPLAFDLDGNSRLNSLDILYLICNVFYCSTFTPPEPAPPSARCGRHARLKPGPAEVPLSCTEHRACTE
jgi:hypothetical protein